MPDGGGATPRVHVAPFKSGRAVSISTTGLPQELIQRAVKRIGFLGLICAVTAPVSYFAERYLQPQRVLMPGLVPFPQIAAIVLFLVGLAIFAAAWSGRIQPHMML